jgi:hypothetical protein
MKTYFSDIIPKIQRFSQKLDNLILLTNQHWVIIDDIDKIKRVYIFRPNNELLISQNGKVEKAKWEYLGNNSILIDRKEDSYLFKHGFFDENVLALKIDGSDEYVFLVNEIKSNLELNSFKNIVTYLEIKYVKNSIPVITKRNSFTLSEPTDIIIKNEIYVGNLEIPVDEDIQNYSDEELMVKYNIHLKDEKYIFLEYKYDLLRDAINYARLKEKSRRII